MIKKAVACLFRLGSLTMIFALPIGFYTGSEDSSHVAIGIHGGTGEFISYFETGCQSPAVVRRHDFSDVQGSLYIRPSLKKSCPIILGLRAGHYSTVPQVMIVNDTLPYSKELSVDYYNLTIDTENDAAGFGLGYIIGDIPVNYSSDNKKTAHFSGHFRAGNPTRTNFRISYNENEPMASGGGYVNVGIGYRVGSSSYASTSYSMGPFHGAGVAQNFYFYLSPNLNWDIGLRHGTSHSKGESSVSMGLGVRF